MSWKNRVILFFAAMGAVSIFGLCLSLVLPDLDAPSQANYQRCLNRVSKQAAGNLGIFNVLRWEQCDKLEPKQEIGLFDDLIPKKELTDSEVFGGPWEKYQIASGFLDAPKKQVTDPLILEKLNAPKIQLFHGYLCTKDCSGHEAGYRWAERRGIDDEDDCTGKSHSFIEGCIAYVEENK